MSLQITLRRAALAGVLSAVTAVINGQVNAAPTVSAEALEAKTGYCKTCHGIDARGFRGATPMPRLAGQQPEYIKNQLEAFIERRRTNPVMNNVAHVLSPEMVTALSEYFKNLNPKPLGGGGAQKELIPEGRKIFEEGVPSANVPPCASCHGEDAKGADSFPRLAGQLPDYIFRKLTNWDKERGQNKSETDTSAIMQPIAHQLTEAQIKAVAAYVSQLE
jgi:cytochrome c553